MFSLFSCAPVGDLPSAARMFISVRYSDLEVVRGRNFLPNFSMLPVCYSISDELVSAQLDASNIRPRSSAHRGPWVRAAGPTPRDMHLTFSPASSVYPSVIEIM